ncbi:hypothetical protein VC83_00901 [Pseudogymnoascus destructans]|uniref:Uncharacterized protein n=1 Tax=Pseudogymnoascus destructans TaxID=655981 RepID=A0A177AM66_9PEZI|nr:uncharacterized protein VC83_00901 [Pseudogymnoascus destructans]OAF62592.1 hypothetical protein VC83_00901 [Pseudogymnoascus destructans]
MTAGDGPERIDSTTMAKPTDEIEPANSTIMEPDEVDDEILTVNPFKGESDGEGYKGGSTGYERNLDIRAMYILWSENTPHGQMRRLQYMYAVWAADVSGWKMPSSPIPDSALESRAMDVPGHRHDQINPNDELGKHQSRPDAINSKPEGEKAEVDKLECAASSLLTMPATEEPENEHAVAMWCYDRTRRLANYRTGRREVA